MTSWCYSTIVYMQLVRTTVRLNENLKKFAERKAIDENKSLQEILNSALERYLEEEGAKEAKEIVFKTHNLGIALDNLTRADYY